MLFRSNDTATTEIYTRPYTLPYTTLFRSQSYLMAVVPPEERSAAAGITGIARTIGASIAPLLVGQLFARPRLISLPFLIAGALKIVYDLLLYRGFASIRPPEEMARPEDRATKS